MAKIIRLHTLEDRLFLLRHEGWELISLGVDFSELEIDSICVLPCLKNCLEFAGEVL